MSDTKSMCPLCDREAVYEKVHEPYGKRFTCKECTEFFIDQSSETHIAGLPEVAKTEHREKLKQKAKDCGPGGLLVIRAPRHDEVGGNGQTSARTTMIAECVSHKPSP